MLKMPTPSPVLTKAEDETQARTEVRSVTSGISVLLLPFPCSLLDSVLKHTESNSAVAISVIYHPLIDINMERTHHAVDTPVMNKVPLKDSLSDLQNFSAFHSASVCSLFSAAKVLVYTNNTGLSWAARLSYSCSVSDLLRTVYATHSFWFFCSPPTYMMSACQPWPESYVRTTEMSHVFYSVWLCAFAHLNRKGRGFSRWAAWWCHLSKWPWPLAQPNPPFCHAVCLAQKKRHKMSLVTFSLPKIEIPALLFIIWTPFL